MSPSEDNDHSIEVLKERIERETAERTAFKELMNERDVRYSKLFDASDKAVFAALAAQEKQTSAAFVASEKAIVKAEDAQREYNARSNEFRGQLDDQAKTLMSRIEAATVFTSYDEKINEIRKDINILREFKSESGGHRSQQSADRNAVQWWIVLVVGLACAIIGWVLKK